MRRPVAPLALALALSGCITVWTRVDAPRVEGPGGRYAVEAPVGWVRFSLDEEAVVLTRDGMAIQFFEARLAAPDKAFRRTKKPLAAGALPAEVADLVLAELRAQAGLADLAVRENGPASVAGQPGFRLRVRYHDARGAAFERLVLGAVHGGEVLAFSYHALATHFFERDRAAFEAFVASYRPGKPR